MGSDAEIPSRMGQLFFFSKFPTLVDDRIFSLAVSMFNIFNPRIGLLGFIFLHDHFTKNCSTVGL